MRIPNARTIILVLATAALVVAGLVYGMKKPGTKVQESQNTNQSSAADLKKYSNEQLGVEFEYPSILSLWEIPTDQLSKYYYYRNPKPDLAIGLSGNFSEGENKLKADYIIAFYKKIVDLKGLFNNYSDLTLKSLSGGQVKIGDQIYEQNESITELRNLHAYELAANLPNGWTIYAMQLSDQSPLDSYTSDPRITNLQKILTTLRTSNGIYFNTLGWKTCRDSRTGIELLYPTSMNCAVLEAAPFDHPNPSDNPVPYAIFNIGGDFLAGYPNSAVKNPTAPHRTTYFVYIYKQNIQPNQIFGKFFDPDELKSYPLHFVAKQNVSIRGETFVVYQSDSSSTDTEVPYPPGPRTIESAGSPKSGWTVYSQEMREELLSPNKPTPINDLSQLIMREIIGSIRLP